MFLLCLRFPSSCSFFEDSRDSLFLLPRLHPILSRSSEHLLLDWSDEKLIQLMTTKLQQLNSDSGAAAVSFYRTHEHGESIVLLNYKHGKSFNFNSHKN